MLVVDDRVLVELGEGDARRDARGIGLLCCVLHDEDASCDMAGLARVSGQAGYPGVNRLQRTACRVRRLGAAVEQRGDKMHLARIEEIPTVLDEPGRATIVIAEGVDDGGAPTQITAPEQRAEHTFGERMAALEHDRLELVGENRPPQVGQLKAGDTERTRNRVDAKDRIIAHEQGQVLAPESDANAPEVMHRPSLEQEHGEHAAYELERQLLGKQLLETLALRRRAFAQMTAGAWPNSSLPASTQRFLPNARLPPSCSVTWRGAHSCSETSRSAACMQRQSDCRALRESQVGVVVMTTSMPT
ncbi:MAG: hypothetical protein V8R08_03180 [Coriobacteriales bacterium]